MAAIKNKSGSFIAPSTASASAALDGATVNAQLVVDALNPSGADSYPITAATYVLIYQKQPDAGIDAHEQDELHRHAGEGVRV